MNENIFHELDRIIHEPGRLSIITLLASVGELSFTELRDQLGMTDGNLSLHIQTLEKAGYVEESRVLRNRRCLTLYKLTSTGREAFIRYLSLLEKIIEKVKEGLDGTGNQIKSPHLHNEKPSSQFDINYPKALDI